ncbi:unnamed protein product [Medioppia subpectinata]|uniref:Uncharacterized protein n=1 Tax=Medioppia subpectinata TaxID=1979941 RepID=A0A7R9Q243_9ACAR|nr:unnamed protein product [Medioppia subpectinata]CAG2109113.1 unnamed protein product [Medioppia subpectinata]
MASDITHVLFDLDGTLINTPEILVDILRDYAKSHGKVLSKEIECVERLVKHLHRHGIHMAIATANRGRALMDSRLKMRPFLDDDLYFSHSVAGYDDPEVMFNKPNPQVYHICVKRFTTPPKSNANVLIVEDSLTGITGAVASGVYSTKFTLIPGVERLVKHLHRHGIQMAIATGTSSRLLAASRVQMKPFLDDGLYFSHGVSAYDDPEVVLKKPDPQVYHICVNRFKTPPKSNANVLVVEDSLTGITGAVASGMKTLLINDQKLCSFETIADRITVICNTFDDFKPETLGFPPYET